MKRIAENITQLNARFKYLTTTIKKWPVLLEVVDGYSERSGNQNALIHKNFSEADQFFHWSPGYAKRFAKYHYGLNILVARTNRQGEPTEDAKYWASLLDRLDMLPYEVRLEFMEKIPVSSEMTTRECARFIDAYMTEWSQQGCPLTDPNEIDPEHYEQLEREARSRGEA